MISNEGTAAEAGDAAVVAVDEEQEGRDEHVVTGSARRVRLKRQDSL